MAKPMKTPGVYVVEKNAFPNSVVEVETAVPAFIGYTQKADYNGASLLNKPTEISSLNDFHQFFGYAPHPMFTMQAMKDTSLKEAASTVSKSRGANAAAVKAAELAAGDAELATVISGLEAFDDEDVDSAPAGGTEAGEDIQAGIDAVVAAAIAETGSKEQAVEAAQSVATALAEEADIANGTLNQLLTTSVDQLPAVLRVTANSEPYSFDQSSGKQLLYYSMRMFFQNGGGKCFIVSVGSFEDDITKDGLSNGLLPLIKEQVPTMLVIPDAVRLEESDCKDVQQSMLQHCVTMANRVAILDIWGGWKEPRDGEVIKNFRENIGNNGLKYGTAYYPWLETSVLSDRNLGLEHIENKKLLSEVLVAEALSQTPDRTKPLKDYDEDYDQVLADIKTIRYSAAELESLGVEKRDALDTLNDSVRARSQVYKNIISELKDKLNLLPPSAAMAGIYTRVDNQRGVWKAPANVSLSMVNRPAVSISHNEQEALNVDLKGKSINAIREFVGEGSMVWGARTLDGNSLDWRYINVRRTLIMLEESTRLAAKAFVFEPNTANTWVTMKGMISNFLTGIWKRGGLAGASPEDAFSVHVGLGETMTPEDILEGIMRITILVAPSRPAEFIEITFQQQAQVS